MVSAESIARAKARRAAAEIPEHGRLSPSSMQRILKCPGSLAITPKDHKSVSSMWADEGTRKHAELAKHLEHMSDVDDPDLNGFLDYVWELRQQYDHIASGIESKFAHPTIEGFSGTVDYWFYGRDEVGHQLFVMDYKHGQHIEVEAEGNLQLKSYVLLITANHPYMLRHCESFRGVIHQPRSFVNPGLKSTRFSIQDLEDLEKQLRSIHSRRNEFRAGDHCQFCPAKMFTDDAGELRCCPVHEELVSLAGGLPRPQTMEELLKSQANVKNFYDNMAEELKRRLKSGVSVPGFGLAKHFGNRTWSDERQLYERLIGANVALEDLEDHKLKSPAQIEKYLKERGVKRDLSDLIIRKFLGYKLVPEEKATTKFYNAETDFKDL